MAIGPARHCRIMRPVEKEYGPGEACSGGLSANGRPIKASRWTRPFATAAIKRSPRGGPVYRSTFSRWSRPRITSTPRAPGKTFETGSARQTHPWVAEPAPSKTPRPPPTAQHADSPRILPWCSSCRSSRASGRRLACGATCRARSAPACQPRSQTGGSAWRRRRHRSRPSPPAPESARAISG